MGNQKKGFFTIKDSVCYTGALFIKLYIARRFNFLKDIKYAFSSAAKAIKAILREIKLHYFSPAQDVSDVTIISESRICIHSRSEFAYAAVGIFACGKVNPYKTIIHIFKKSFSHFLINFLDIVSKYIF
mgnify:CR=1 FL=1